MELFMYRLVAQTLLQLLSTRLPLQGRPRQPLQVDLSLRLVVWPPSLPPLGALQVLVLLMRPLQTRRKPDSTPGCCRCSSTHKDCAFETSKMP